MKKVAIAAAAVLALSACSPAQASGRLSARMGEPVEVNGIEVSVTQKDRSCWRLSVENTRLLRGVKPEEAGVVRAYAGVQDSIIYLAEGRGNHEEGVDYRWSELAPLKRGESKSVKLCGTDFMAPDRVQVDVAGSTIEFS